MSLSTLCRRVGLKDLVSNVAIYSGASEGHVRFERHKLSGRKWVHVDPSEGHVLHPIYTNAGLEADAESRLC
ncbi:hypothetical protein B296_00010611 [Ensete ventricosum]|uniref:Uncharacterized protein n=1 Tax=Ensete ventricosum TaxID=4639 RepID=A0A426ZXI2_ENSVE|nr:hypothetical protein B296_00010611 [Ensete ventricosum]